MTAYTYQDGGGELPRTWREINREVREAREIIGRLEELAAKAGREGDRIMIAFYTGKLSYEEAYKKLKALAEAQT